MKQAKIAELESELAEIMKQFTERDEVAVESFCLGSSTHLLMAKAAMAVLIAIDDAQDYLYEGGFMKEDE
jgi:hypothetical protein